MTGFWSSWGSDLHLILLARVDWPLASLAANQMGSLMASHVTVFSVRRTLPGPDAASAITRDSPSGLAKKWKDQLDECNERV